MARPAAGKRSTTTKTTAEALLRAHPLVFDGLNCAAVTAGQMQTMRRGNVSAMNWTAIRPSSNLAQALLDLEAAWMLVGELREEAAIATSVAGIEAAHKSGRIAIVLGAQNSLMFEGDLGHIGVFKRLGLRIVQPTYNEKNRFGFGAPFLGKADKGITAAGRDWLAEMERQNLLVDLSHCGHRTTLDYIAAAKRPLVCSHANALAVCPSPRNKTDEMIKGVASTGGLTGAVMWSPAVSHATRPTLDDYLDHLDHLLRVGGIEHVAFASDVSEGLHEDPATWERMWGRNGIYPNITGLCGDWYRCATRHNVHYDSLAHTPRIWDGLRRRGYQPGEIEKVMSGNWLRVLADVWGE